MTETPQSNIYPGNCHCARFRFTINTAEPITRATACNCSICFKKGYLVFKLQPEQLEFTRGDEKDLSVYTFGEKEREHYFCPTCGTALLLRKRGEVWANVRSLRDVDAWRLEVELFDGAQLRPAYTPPAFKGVLPFAKEGEEEAGSKIYTGGCHCGAVTLALRSKPLLSPEVEVKEDNCSICRRNANVCVYPHKSQVSILGTENTTEYLFGGRANGHCFCKICGVHVFMNLRGPPAELVQTWPEKRREMVMRKLEILPLRVRVLDLDEKEWNNLGVERTDEGTEGYVVD